MAGQLRFNKTRSLWTALLLTFLFAAGAHGQAAFQDEFNGAVLGAGWTTVDGYAQQFPGDPANHATLQMTGQALSLAFPGGAEHNQWLLRHVQVIRPYLGSGVYEIKVNSAMTGDQQFGIAFESSPGTFMQFMFYSTDQVRAFIERFAMVGGTLHKTTVFGQEVGLGMPSAGPFYLRVVVTDNALPQNRNWRFDWSPDGSTWTQLASAVFETSSGTANAGAIQQVGVFAGNQPAAFSAFNAQFDYFRYYTSLDNVPLPTPGNVVARGADHQVELWWDAVQSADSYNVYLVPSGGGSPTLLGTTNTPTYIDASAANGAVRTYVVAAKRGATVGPQSSQVVGVAHVNAELDALPAAGLVLALNAGELALVQGNNTPVNFWPNARGPKTAARGAAGTAAPVLIHSAADGKPAIRFDGSNDHLTLPSGFQDFTGGMSLYVVMRPTVLQTGFKVLALGNGAGSSNIVLGRAGSTAGFQYITTDQNGSFGFFNTSSGLTAGQNAMVSVVQNGGAANSQTLAEVASNGSLLNSQNVFVPPVTTRSLNYVGKSYWADGMFQGDIAEIILYSRKLSAAERTQVGGYLTQKYNLNGPQPPVAPSGVTAVAGNASVALSWSSVTGATGYRVLRGTTSGGPYSLVGSPSGTSFGDSGLANGTTYYYVVRTFDGSLESANSSQASATPVAPPSGPAAPTGVNATAGNGSVTLGWNAVSGATSYRVYRSTTSGGSYSLVGSPAGTSHADNGLTNGTTYYYVVRAHNGSVESANSSQVSATPVGSGGGNPSLPATGLALALDAQVAATQYSNGAAVTLWQDSSSFARNATASGSAAPTLVTNAIGGKAALRFDGADDFLSLPTGFQDFTAGMTLYMVMRPTVLQTGFKAFALGNGGGVHNIVLGRAGSGPGMQFFTNDASGGVQWFNTNDGLVAGEVSLISVTQDAGAANALSFAEVAKNGVALAGQNVYVPPVTNRAVNYIGKSYWAEGAFQGDIAEIILYSRKLTAAEQTQVRNYVTQKYSIGAAPAAPTGVNATAASGSVTLGWNAVSGATSYRVYRSTTSGGSYSLVGSPAGTSYADNGLTNGTTYYYVVRAHNGSVESANSSQVSATPAGSGGNPSLPAVGLALALDAQVAATQYSNGAAVTLWQDSSSFARNATASGSAAPTLVTNVIGGKAVLRFDGADDFLSLPTGFQDFTAGMSLYMVMRPTVLQTGFKAFALGNGGGTHNIVLGRAGSSAGLQFFTNNSSGAVQWFNTSDGLVAGEASLISVMQEPGAANALSFAEVAKNGVALFGQNVYVPPVTGRAVNYIGKSYWAEGAFQGDIAEVILYSRKLNATEHSQVRAYIAQKYGLSVQ